jgi:hypothetical protein
MMYQHQHDRRITDQWHELSLEISYALMANPPNELALLTLILGQPPPPSFREPLLEAIRFLLLGYGTDRRKSGPLAVLHPMRTAAMLGRSLPKLQILDLLGAFLHDRDEDISPDRIPQARWAELQQKLERLLGMINHDEQWFLGERIAILSRKRGQTYFDYLVNIIRNARTMPDLLRIKLADKLDSTYDIQVPPSRFERLDFYQVVFDLLFLPTYSGLAAHDDYFLVGEREAMLLLSSMAKNAVFLSLLRQTGHDRDDPTIELLFDALAFASIRQARWVLLELFATSLDSVDDQREMLKDVLAYCEDGAIAAITSRERGHPLDGTFLERLVVASDQERRQRLAEVYADRTLFAKVVTAMIIIFSCFRDDPRFRIEGIEIRGIHAAR